MQVDRDSSLSPGECCRPLRSVQTRWSHAQTGWSASTSIKLTSRLSQNIKRQSASYRQQLTLSVLHKNSGRNSGCFH